ncbi:acyltransferase family protein [Legionella shakespearei]|uniref:Putative Heparan-alpha-glucosaminide N-acetyltransferase n=1 Tax=Legionella shakespearei DSM 23087 TaxID=1122169 RepID=A0A0W0YW40_9GAMM|nr:heparan-alpha-glucosaminide N-acetyltransferase domain-containing protein [Legionella shakespearei]KTD60862.1 putative Heparan-alpha-glucosaminide N-acetyltransferase [Legionella shakespearei DSM 23087]
MPLSQASRILSLDVFRGLTIVFMILVNSQGNDSAYPVLEHAAWNGCTLADIVFPSFLFIVGVTTVISLRKQIGQSTHEVIYRSIMERSFIMFALGLFLNVFPNHFDFYHLRIYGILQRIALCYLACSFIYLKTTIKTQLFIFLSILFGYWLVMTQIPVPGYGANQLDSEGSWVSFFDQMIFSADHLLEKTYDPEGFFTTIPSIATTLSGVLTGSLLLSSLSKNKKCILMLGMGGLFLLLGGLWDSTFPINKNLWTSSFVLWTSGYALITFALCFLIIDIWNVTKWALPLKIFGMNALFAFVLHVLLLKLQFIFYYPLSTGKTGNLKATITDYFFSSFSEPNAALFYSLAFLLLNFIVVTFLYRRKIFIRI